MLSLSLSLGLLQSLHEEFDYYITGAKEAAADGDTEGAKRDRETFQSHMIALVELLVTFAPQLKHRHGDHTAVTFHKLQPFLSQPPNASTTKQPSRHPVKESPTAPNLPTKETKGTKEATVDPAISQAMIKQLHEELRLSEARIHEAQTRHEAMEAEMEKQQTKMLQDMQSMEAKMEKQQTQMLQDIQTMEAEMEKQQTQMLQDMQTIESSMKQKLKKKRARCIELTEQNTQLEQLSKEICEELQNMTRLNVSLDATNQQLRKDLVARTMAPSGTTTNNPANKSMMECLNIALANEKDRYEALQQSCSHIEKEATTWQQQCTLLHHNVQSLETKLHTALGRVDAKESEIRSLEFNMEELKKEKKGLVEKLQSLSGEFLYLNEQILTMQGNVKVFCRVNGPLALEDGVNGMKPGPDNTLEYLSKVYQFDTVFYDQQQEGHEPQVDGTPSDWCRDMFQEVEPLVRAVLVGTTTGIFTYGRSNGSKTSTLLGSGGLARFALESIFHFVKTRMQLEEVMNDDEMKQQPEDEEEEGELDQTR